MSTKQRHGYNTMFTIVVTMIMALSTLATHAQDPIINLLRGNMRVKAFIDSVEKQIKVCYSAEQVDTSAYIRTPAPSGSAKRCNCSPRSSI